MKRNGFLQKADDYLKEAGMEVRIIEGVEPDPSVTTVMNGAALMAEFEPDRIVLLRMQLQTLAQDPTPVSPLLRKWKSSLSAATTTLT